MESSKREGSAPLSIVPERSRFDMPKNFDAKSANRQLNSTLNGIPDRLARQSGTPKRRHRDLGNSGFKAQDITRGLTHSRRYERLSLMKGTYRPPADSNYPPPPSPPSNQMATSPLNSLSPLNQQSTYQQQSYDGINGTSEESTPPPQFAEQQPLHVPDHPLHHSTMQETDQELTEDERAAYEAGILDWNKMKSWRYWIRREWLWYYILGLVIVVVVGLMAFFHKDVSEVKGKHILMYP